MIDLEAIRQRLKYGEGLWAAPYRADTDALLAEVERLTEWMPIETPPPQDSDALYLVVIDGGVSAAWYFPAQGAWCSDEGTYDQDDRRERITHWRPMPEPPPP